MVHVDVDAADSTNVVVVIGVFVAIATTVLDSCCKERENVECIKSVRHA